MPTCAGMVEVSSWRKGRRSWRARLLWIVPFLVLVVGSSAALQTNVWQRDRIDTSIHERFTNETDLLVNSFSDLIAKYEAINPSIRDAARFPDGRRATEEEFSVFSAQLILGSRFPSAYGIAWADSV